MNRTRRIGWPVTDSQLSQPFTGIETSGLFVSRGEPKGKDINPEKSISDLSKLFLYNLTNDPGEQKSLLANGGTPEAQAKARELHALLRRYIASGRSTPLPQAAQQKKQATR